MEPNNLVSFFVSAHQDDWQIFAGNIARDDAGLGKKLVFVYLTAGDDCKGEGYWRAREAGAIASTLLLAPCASAQPDNLTFAGRPICRWTIGNTESYFLRLPEHRLRAFKGGRPNLEPVDGSAPYPDWNSLVNMLEYIFYFELGDCLTQNSWITTSDYLVDIFPPPGVWVDHEDHAPTGDVVRMIAKGKYNVRYWPGYEDTRRRQRVNDGDFSHKKSLMIEYCRVVKERYPEQGDYASAQGFFEPLMRYTYIRTESP